MSQGAFTEDVVEQACLGWLAKLRDILLSKFISGELRVKDAEQEAEDAL